MKIIKGEGFSLCLSVEENMVFMERRLNEPLDAAALTRTCDKHGVALMDEDECESELLSDDVVLVWGYFIGDPFEMREEQEVNAA